MYPSQPSGQYGNNPYANNPNSNNASPINQGYSPLNNPYQAPNANNAGYNPLDPNIGQPNVSAYRGLIGANSQPQQNKQLDGDLSNSSRAGFIRKVYVLVCIQLLITTAIGYWGFNSDWFKHNIATSLPVVIVVSVILFGLSIVIGCCTDCFRRYALPIFIVFTLLMSILVAISIGRYQSSVVLLSVAITMTLVIGLTIYAWVTKTDFTGMGPYLLVLSLMLFCFGIALIFWKNSVAQLVYACLGALLFSIYIIYDTQLIVGKGKFSYSLDDAYFAAIQLYLDIINLFLMILQAIGGGRS